MGSQMEVAIAMAMAMAVDVSGMLVVASRQEMLVYESSSDGGDDDDGDGMDVEGVNDCVDRAEDRGESGRQAETLYSECHDP